MSSDEIDYIHAKIVKHTSVDFSNKVINLSKKLDISYIEAVMEMVENKKIEIEVVAKLLTPELKELIEAEAIKNKLIKNDD